MVMAPGVMYITINLPLLLQFRIHLLYKDKDHGKTLTIHLSIRRPLVCDVSSKFHICRSSGIILHSRLTRDHTLYMGKHEV
jgi:hypothetical protein